jgi:uncharacterized protein YraI
MHKTTRTYASLALTVLIAMTLVISACATPTPAPTQDIGMVQTQAAQTVVADLTQNAPAPTQAAPATEVPAVEPPGPTPHPSVPVAVVPAPASGEPSAVANYNTTINSGPGDDYVVYGSFVGGASAIVVGKSEDGAWWAISVPVAPNGTGWVDAEWVTVTGADSVAVLPTPPVPPTTELVSPGPDDPQATTIANTYVRSGPGANYPAYGIAPSGSTARVIGVSEDGQWWVVRVNPENIGVGYGWVMVQYTQASNVDEVQVVQNPNTHTSIPPAPPPADGPAATATEYVNVRTGPGSSYPILGVAAPGATAEVSGKSADGAWWQVKIPAQYSSSEFGWVSASYVTTQNTDNVPEVDAPAPPPSVGPTPPAATGTGCSLVSQTPADGTTLTIDTPFNTTWVIKNTGSVKWDQAEVDVRYVGAASNVQLHTGADVYDLTSSVEPGDTYNFTVPMIAPFNMGTYGEVWELATGNQQICQFYVYINVP